MTEHPNLASALVAALADLCVVEKGRKANAGSYSYDYAALEDVVKATRPVLASHGLVALTPLGAHNNDLAVSVIFLHAPTNERMDLGPFPFPHGRDAQATGSMVTYHRRYALLAALGMAAGDDDDDGAAAQPRQREQARPAPPKPLAGWSSFEEQDAAHEDFRSLVADLDEPVQAAMREFRKGAGFGWPMPKRDLDQMYEYLAEVQASTPEVGEPAPSAAAKRKARARAIAEENGLPMASELSGPQKARAALSGGEG